MAALKLALYLCAAMTCVGCALLLGREYLRTRVRLLLWSTLCFIMLSVSNILLVIDLGIFPTSMDLRLVRVGSALIGMLFLLYGFWESESGDPWR